MGLGLVLSALSGAGKSLADSAGDYQKFNDQQAMLDKQKANEIDLAQAKSDIGLRAENLAAQAKIARENEPINRFQKIVSGYLDKYQNDPTLIQAAAAPDPGTPAAAASGGSTIPPDTDTSGGWGAINASFKAGEPARNNARLGVLNAELANETDPEQIAIRKREIGRLAPADSTVAGATGGDASTAAVDAGGAAIKASQAAIQKAAFLAAVADAKVNDPLAYKAAAETFKGEHVLVGQGGAIVNPLSGETVFHNDTAEKIAQIRADALDDRTDKQIAAKERMIALKADSDSKKAVVDPKSVDDLAAKIASYSAAPMGDRLRGTPFGQAVTARISELNPDWNQIRYGTIDKATKAFATGKQGDNARSFNVAIDHIGTAGGLIDALANKDTTALNKVGNFFGKQFGSDEQTNFISVKSIVADEIAKAVIGGQTAQGDREKLEHNLDEAKSPEQLRGVITQWKSLMRGQLDGLRDQYQRTTGNNDFDETFLSAAARAVAHGAPAGTASAIQAPAAGRSKTVVNPLASPTAANRPSLDSIFSQ